MGLFGSLFTGVSALFAQSQATSIVSNNIANVNTIGFKRSEASFNSLVTTESRLSRYSPGTVSVSRTQRVDQQGSIQQTASSTDAAISGNGFFPVKRSTDFGQEFLYTRAGQFSEDASGLLRNAAGFVLYAWPIDSSGNLPANQGDLDSLVPADVAFLGGLTRPTNNAEIALNLDADQAKIDPHQIATAQTLPVDNQAAHFSRGLTVFDSLGTAQTVTLEFRHVMGPMAHFTSDSASPITTTDTLTGGGASTGILSGINNNDAFSITVDGTTETFEFADDASVVTTGTHEIVTGQDLLDAINGFNGGGVLEARLTSTGQLSVQAVNPALDVAIEEVTGTPITGGSSTLNVVPDPANGGYEYSTNSGGGLTGGTDLAATLAGVDNNDVFTVTVGGTSETYEISNAGFVAGADHNVTTVTDLINEINGFDGGGVLQATLVGGELSITPVNSATTFSLSDTTGTSLYGTGGLGIVPEHLVFSPEFNVTNNTGPASSSYTQTDFPSFAETGSPNTQGWWEVTLLHPDGTNMTQGLINFNGDGSINAARDSDGDIDIELSNINWGNGSTLQSFDIDIERFSQFAGNYDVISSDQDGAELGLRTGVELTREGKVVARFSNGASADLYQVPLTTFANQNGLTEVSGTAYTETEESGEENLREAGTGGAGFVEASTLEASNVDLADEFAKLIVSQRAFGAGTRVINTVDQMTEDLLRLR